MSVLSKPYFHDEAEAFKHVEALLWADGRVCPHCGTIGNSYPLKGVRSKASKKNPEGVERHGLYKCGDCRKQFTVRIGTIFEESHLPLHKWLQAIHLVCSSKKGISAHQLHRVLEVQYKTAWFLEHRIREAMRNGDFSPMGSGGKPVEVDETYIGKPDYVTAADMKTLGARRGGGSFKNVVLTLVERGGAARSFHIENASVASILPILNANLARETALLTDSAALYRGQIGKSFGSHDYVDHSAFEWGRGEVHTNTVEGFYSIFKRGMKGVYQHCSEKHLHRYLAEFDFRYTNRIALGIDDTERAELALKGTAGKRLTYKTANLAS